MSYMRVLPWDAFNEANLMKCIGQLTLLIYDNQAKWLNFEHDGEAFDIIMDENTREISVTNIDFYTSEGKQVYFTRPLNSRESWPLYATFEGNENDRFAVFDDKGTFILNKADFI